MKRRHMNARNEFVMQQIEARLKCNIIISIVEYVLPK